jgi:hypothetical protein
VVAIKAIQTEYQGHLFRSRLEARWAVFFDALSIGWHYEEQGFELPSGRYLPDFRIDGGALLGTSDLWVEVKGKFEHNEFVKLIRSAHELPRATAAAIQPQLLILGEVPIPGDPFLHTRIDVRPTEFALQRVRFRGHRPAVGRLCWTTSPIDDPDVFPVSDLDQWTDEATAYMRDSATAMLCDFTLQVDRTVDAAYRSARSARFEHGQVGAML